MNLFIGKTPRELGEKAAEIAAREINKAIAEKGSARIILSTGASQFETLESLVKKDIKWDCVTMFHLDEYVGLPETHIASFRKYLKERFVGIVHPKNAYFVSGEGDIQKNIKKLTTQLRKEPVDVALIGIGENGHIAFNDPPADFKVKDAYIVVDLDDACKLQQIGEGWFKTMQDVPEKAISMTVYQIMKSNCILSSVPGKRKAEAVRKTLSAQETTPMVPATMLKEHKNWSLFLDEGSASLLDKNIKHS